MAKRLSGRYGQYPLAYTGLGYLFFTMAFCYHPIDGHWLTGFVMMTLPLAILSGLVASIYLICRGEKTIATAGLIWVLFSLPVVKRLIGTSSGLGQFALNQAPALTILSFNSESFSEAAGHSADFPALKADIACFQEYAPNVGIEKQYTAKVEKLTCFDQGREVGLALLSKYPVVNQYGRIWDRVSGPDINGFLCADIAYGPDTIRVVNVHLWSMGVRIKQAFDALKTGDLRLFSFEFFDTLRRLKEGFEYRSEQLAEVESYVAGSRYPVIICGDFNETPFGYSYGKLSLNFRNAFEEAGDGMGFTLNRHPYWVRIDQQFFSADWAVTSCQTLSNISFSDHFPVVARYVLKRSAGAPTQLAAQHKRTVQEIAQK
ncbi:endonuclease/exonuclease/phosphatase family protein [Nibrella saemangeumensis]